MRQQPASWLEETGESWGKSATMQRFLIDLSTYSPTMPAWAGLQLTWTDHIDGALRGHCTSPANQLHVTAELKMEQWLIETSTLIGFELVISSRERRFIRMFPISCFVYLPANLWPQNHHSNFISYPLKNLQFYNITQLISDRQLSNGTRRKRRSTEHVIQFNTWGIIYTKGHIHVILA